MSGSVNNNNNNNRVSTLVLGEDLKNAEGRYKHVATRQARANTAFETATSDYTELAAYTAYLKSRSADDSQLPPSPKLESAKVTVEPTKQKQPLDNETLKEVISGSSKSAAHQAVRHSVNNQGSLHVNPLHKAVNETNVVSYFTNLLPSKHSMLSLSSTREKKEREEQGKLAEGIYTQLSLKPENRELILTTLQKLFEGLEADQKNRFIQELAILTTFNDEEFSETLANEFVLLFNSLIEDKKALYRAIVDKHQEKDTFEKCIVIFLSLKDKYSEFEHSLLREFGILYMELITVKLMNLLLDRLFLNAPSTDFDAFLKSHKDLEVTISKCGTEQERIVVQEILTFLSTTQTSKSQEEGIKFIYKFCEKITHYELMIKTIFNRYHSQEQPETLHLWLKVFFELALETEQTNNEFLRGKSPAFVLASHYMNELLAPSLYALHKQFAKKAANTTLEQQVRFKALASNFIQAIYGIDFTEEAKKVLKTRINCIEKQFKDHPDLVRLKRISTGNLTVLRAIGPYFSGAKFKKQAALIKDITTDATTLDASERCFVQLSKVVSQLANEVPFVDGHPLSFLNPLLEELRPTYQKFLDQFLG